MHNDTKKTQFRMMTELKAVDVGNDGKTDSTSYGIFSFSLQILMQETGRLLEMWK